MIDKFLGVKMNYSSFNPVVRAVSLYEKIERTDECVGYDCRLIYLLSGDLTASVDGKKLGHLSPGSLLYIPAGLPYKLKSKYLRAVVICFDPTDDCPEPATRIPAVALADFDPSLCHKAGLDAPLDKPKPKINSIGFAC